MWGFDDAELEAMEASPCESAAFPSGRSAAEADIATPFWRSVLTRVPECSTVLAAEGAEGGEMVSNVFL